MGHRDSFCGSCGARYDDQVLIDGVYPRICNGCGTTLYNSPHLVSVMVIPVAREQGEIGILAVRRAIEPHRGELALPGGFVEGARIKGGAPRESVQAAGVREVFEETSIRLAFESIEELCIVGPTESGAVLYFQRSAPVKEQALSVFAANEEVSELVVIDNPATTLAFTTHTEVLRWVLDPRGQRSGCGIWEYSSIMRDYRPIGSR